MLPSSRPAVDPVEVLIYRIHADTQTETVEVLIYRKADVAVQPSSRHRALKKKVTKEHFVQGFS